MRVQQGKKTVETTREQLLEKAANYSEVLLDIGCGDGKFVYRWAAAHPTTFCIGLDASVDAIIGISAKSAKKPTRGGLANVIFVVAAVEHLPNELTGLADSITINYPWGSLLSLLVKPDIVVLREISEAGKPNATLTMLLNYSVFKDVDYSGRLGLPELTSAYVEDVLKPSYRSAGFEIVSHQFLYKDVPHRTSWGQSLILGGGRESLMIEARSIRNDHGRTDSADQSY